MGARPPFLYDPIREKAFDPKAVTRASRTPKAPRPKQDGPLVSFNQHPDSFLILPYGNINASPMKRSIKKWIKWTRVLQLALRCFELLSAGGLLAMMIMVRGVEDSVGWALRIVPGIAILHTIYGIYHLSRKASGRTPASSMSYMLFAAFFDASILPFYAFGALAASTRQSSWKIILDDQSLTPTFAKVVFYCSTVGAGLHLISLIISIYLAVTFRRITSLPPDMNPLEDNLTSRHKRNKSSMSTVTTMSEKRLSTPLESKRSSGATYEDLSRPPSMPFFHTRTQSTNSSSTYKSTPPPSRDSRNDLPSRQYQAVSNSPRSSVVDLKRASGYGPPTPPKRASYQEIPLSETGSHRSSRPVSDMAGGWYTSDSLSKPRTRSSSPRKGNYQPLHQQYGSEDLGVGLPNPLEANPPTPRHSYNINRDSPLTEISKNRGSGDIADMSSEREVSLEPLRESGFKSRYYGDLKPATPPVIVSGNTRQASSGNDFLSKKSGFRARDASGKIAEEGLGGSANGWGTRFRKVSGI
ncbi:Uncharacterized protein BP5553_06352 [Venustampulla echinocandica]|uniref:Uncharacterized protein n=1 Tax=Venustampulla echinocandica TaxID=2656787 RepID=A0A370TJN6_9HELO|nr:Uncharacterized protein BP5553_06352 [Venustampulla echinocandica]RDL35740.1 Uncharacterized protein BP5553_06352 [Venustampulla echinocandica]